MFAVTAGALVWRPRANTLMNLTHLEKQRTRSEVA